VSMVKVMTSMLTIPCSAGGTWEFTRDSRTLIRYRKTGDLAWKYLGPADVAAITELYFS
jgi:hypothetical protein